MRCPKNLAHESCASLSRRFSSLPVALADCSAVDDELLLDVADVAADLPLALADLSLHRTSCTRAGVDALRDALAKDEHNTALRIDFDGPPADDAPPPVLCRFSVASA